MLTKNLCRIVAEYEPTLAVQLLKEEKEVSNQVELIQHLLKQDLKEEEELQVLKKAIELARHDVIESACEYVMDHELEDNVVLEEFLNILFTKETQEDVADEVTSMFLFLSQELGYVCSEKMRERLLSLKG